MTLIGGWSIRAVRSCWPKSPRNWNFPARPCAFLTTSSRTMATCRHRPFCLSCGRSWIAAGHNPAKKGCSSRSAPAFPPSRRSWNLRHLNQGDRSCARCHTLSDDAQQDLHGGARVEGAHGEQKREVVAPAKLGLTSLRLARAVGEQSAGCGHGTPYRFRMLWFAFRARGEKGEHTSPRPLVASNGKMRLTTRRLEHPLSTRPECRPTF